MANAIITIDRSFTSTKESKITLAPLKNGGFMARSQMLDAVTASQRLRTPFAFRWLKFKNRFFGLNIKKGTVQ